jgi:hypothetical protein
MKMESKREKHHTFSNSELGTLHAVVTCPQGRNAKKDTYLKMYL